MSCPLVLGLDTQPVGVTSNEVRILTVGNKTRAACMIIPFRRMYRIVVSGRPWVQTIIWGREGFHAMHMSSILGAILAQAASLARPTVSQLFLKTHPPSTALIRIL